MREVKRVSSLILVLILTFNLTSVAVRLAFAEGAFRVARIRSFEGTVKIMKSGGEKSFDAFEGMSLTEGDSITTEGNSCVVLDIDDDKEVKIGENSMVNLSQLSGLVESGSDQTVISLWVGKIWTNIRKGLNIRAKYEIKVPTAIIGVRGTQFAVEYGRGQNDISVLEGEVLATKFVPGEPDSNGQNVIEKFEFIIRANEQVQFNDSDRSVEDVKVNEVTAQSLSLFVLEILKEYIGRDPSSVNPDIAKDIDEQIEIKTIEESAIKQEQQQDITFERRVEVDPVVDAPEAPASVVQDAGWYDEPTVDTTPPTFVSGYPAIGDVGSNSVELVLRVNEQSATDFYCVMLKESEMVGNEPRSPEEVIEWVESTENPDYQGWEWAFSGSVQTLPEYREPLTHIPGGTSYKLYIALKDAEGNISQDLAIVDATTLPDTILPVFESGYPKTGTVGDSSVELVFKTSERSDIYYLVLRESEIVGNAPQSTGEVIEWVRNGNDSYQGWNWRGEGFATPFYDYTYKVPSMPGATSYKVYIALADTSDNRSAEVATMDVMTLPDTTPPAFASGYPKIGILGANSIEQIVKTNDESRVYCYNVLVKESEIGDYAPKSAAEVVGWRHEDYPWWENSGYGSVYPSSEHSHVYENLQGGTRYKLYLALKDLSGNISEEFVELEVTTDEDDVPPAFNAGYPRLTDAGSHAMNLIVSSNEAARVHYVVLKTRDEAVGPNSPEEVMGWTPLQDRPSWSGGMSFESNREVTRTINNLAENTQYRVYLTLEDLSGNTSPMMVLDTATPSDAIPSVFSEGYPSISNIGLNSFDVTFKSSENFNGYYVILKESDAAEGPNSASEVAGWIPRQDLSSWSGETGFYGPDREVTRTISNLEENTLYKVYFALEDLSGNFSQMEVLDADLR